MHSVESLFHSRGYQQPGEGSETSLSGGFTNPVKRTAFEAERENGVASADILKIDARFVSLLKWLGENHINVRMSEAETEEGYSVYKIKEIAFGGGYCPIISVSGRGEILLWRSHMRCQRRSAAMLSARCPS